MDTEITIRSEQKTDCDAIREVNDLAFGQKTEGILVESLRATPCFIPELSLVAVLDDKIVGHILFYPININNQNIKFDTLSLAPMAVRPEYQKKGIGGQLIKEGLKRAGEMGHESVIVLGHAGYYPRFVVQPFCFSKLRLTIPGSIRLKPNCQSSFVKASQFGIKAPFDCPDDAFMAIELKPGALKNVTGIVEYPKPYLDA